jgi:hypothetical protein
MPADIGFSLENFLVSLEEIRTRELEIIGSFLLIPLSGEECNSDFKDTSRLISKESMTVVEAERQKHSMIIMGSEYDRGRYPEIGFKSGRYLDEQMVPAHCRHL